MKSEKYVQYGCGFSNPKGWRNFDASPTLRFERLPFLGKLYTKNSSRFPENVEFGDIVMGLPIADQSCRGVYCSHVLEHLSLNDFRTALVNTRKILQPGGIFRLVLPDFELSVKNYVSSSSDDAVIQFMRETSLGYESRPKGIRGLISSWLGNSQHLWMWDYKCIAVELKAAGFIDVRRAVMGDSEDEKFQTIEEQSRWENCLGVECTVPK